MVQKIRDADAKAAAEGRMLTLSELADVAEAAGFNPTKIAKLRQIIKERNLEEGVFTTNGLLPTNNSTLANNGTLTNAPMNNTVPINDANVNNVKENPDEDGGFNYWIIIGIVAIVIVVVVAAVLLCR
ncbi:hypothetical protein PIROE2DRAFT_67396, partial [Piromyces sp. E2]